METRPKKPKSSVKKSLKNVKAQKVNLPKGSGRLVVPGHSRGHSPAGPARGQAVAGPSRSQKSAGPSRCQVVVGGSGKHARKQSQRQPKAVNRDTDSSSEDAEDSCAALKCAHPSGSVDWVQCDGGCQNWFHLKCIGLQRVDLKLDEDYICNVCYGLYKQPVVAQPTPAPPALDPKVLAAPVAAPTERAAVPTTMDENLGLDALLSLANGFPPSNDPMMSSVFNSPQDNMVGEQSPGDSLSTNDGFSDDYGREKDGSTFPVGKVD